MRLPLKCVDLKSLITFLSVYTLLWIAKSLSLSYLDWVKMGKSCNGATNPVRTNFHFVSWLSQWDWSSIAFYPLSPFVIFTFSINELAHLSRTPNETDIYCSNRVWQNIAVAWINNRHTGAELRWGTTSCSDDVFKWTLQN